MYDSWKTRTDLDEALDHGQIDGMDELIGRPEPPRGEPTLDQLSRGMDMAERLIDLCYAAMRPPSGPNELYVGEWLAQLQAAIFDVRGDLEDWMQDTFALSKLHRLCRGCGKRFTRIPEDAATGGHPDFCGPVCQARGYKYGT